ncbi:MAG TPA: RHS repeat-associated core domain-containing protein, partial [Thermoanaerobaculia bacterium]
RIGGEMQQRLRLPGQEAIEDNWGTGQVYNIFRWYRSAWSRFNQPDPIGLRGGLNLYAYVDGNPLIGFDPAGLKKVCCTEGSKKLWKDAKKAEKNANNLLANVPIQGVEVAATGCIDLNPGGQPTTVFYPPYDEFGPCEQACTRAHEGSHASLCKQFGWAAYTAYQEKHFNKEEALAYLVEANCLASAANNGYVDVEQDYPDAPAKP